MTSTAGLRCVIAGLLLWAMPALAYDPGPWLADLQQMRKAFDSKYANLDWLTGERELDLDKLFDETGSRVKAARDDAGAKAAFDRLIRRVGDGHVALSWPAAGGAGTNATPPTLCGSLGFDSRRNSAGPSAALNGYRPLAGENAFPAGLITSGKQRVGVIRIGVFQPEGSPALCEAATKALRLPGDKPCDQTCSDAVVTWAYDRFNRDFQDRLRALKAAGATALFIDIAGNGGGSEWAEAAARMVSGKPIRSAQLGFVRGEHWAKQWQDRADTLRGAQKTAAPADRARLADWIAQAERGAAEARRDCGPGKECDRIGRLGYATGLVGEAKAGTFAGKDWAPQVFDISQYDYRDGIWSGPLLVLVDQETWSAAEEFAALIQDNGAGVVIGARTGGAGCGHTNGGTPTTLANSKAVLELPDCVRLRRDGSNEVRGIIPDTLIGLRANDGARFKAGLVEAKLPEALALAARRAAR